MKAKFRWLLVLGLLIVLLVGVRQFWLTQVVVPSYCPDLKLLVGDRIIVDRLAYVLDSRVEKGDVVVYYLPNEHNQLCVGRVQETVHAHKDVRCLINQQSISCDSIVGKVRWVSYSVDPQRPAQRQFRMERILQRVE